MKKILTVSLLVAVVTMMSGVAQAAVIPPTNNVPDAGSTSALVALALSGLTILRRYVR